MLLHLHPTTPQRRLIERAAALLQRGGVAVVPTDSCYALACIAHSREGPPRMRQIRALAAEHPLTLLCRDLSEASLYGTMDNYAYRLMRAHTPGPYTFILCATREAPKKSQHLKRKTVGLRIPDHPVTQMLLAHLDAPLMSTSLILAGEPYALNEAEDIAAQLAKKVDVIIDAGPCSLQPSTVIDLVDEKPRIERIGKGDPAAFA